MAGVDTEARVMAKLGPVIMESDVRLKTEIGTVSRAVSMYGRRCVKGQIDVRDRAIR